MAHKLLFGRAGKAPLADSMNEAKGPAYAFSPEHALAQYAATGTFYQTFYANEEEQHDKVLDLASQVSPVLVAKTAVFARERGYMKVAQR